MHYYSNRVGNGTKVVFGNGALTVGRCNKPENAETIWGWRYTYGNKSGPSAKKSATSCAISLLRGLTGVSRFPSQPPISQQKKRLKKNR